MVWCRDIELAQVKGSIAIVSELFDWMKIRCIMVSDHRQLYFQKILKIQNKKGMNIENEHEKRGKRKTAS